MPARLTGPRTLLVVAGLGLLALLAAIATSEATSSAEVAKLTASDGAAGDQFALSVAIDSNTAIAGARFADGPGADAGAVYIYERNAGGPDAWGEVAKRTASDAEAGDTYGASVGLSGDVAIAGAPADDAAGNDAGAAYIIERDHGGSDAWDEVTKLVASDAETGDLFGAAVAIGGDTAIVGASQQSAAGASAGAAYIVQRDAGGTDSWGQVQKLVASDGEAFDFFGSSVAISGDIAVVGAWMADGGAGAAYVFRRDEGGADAWGEVTKLVAADRTADDRLGFSVGIRGDTAVVGAYFDDEGGEQAGAAYVFQRDAGGPNAWGEVAKLTASDAEAGDLLGRSVAVGDGWLIAGAMLEASRGGSAGAAYVFERDAGGANAWGEVKKLLAGETEAGDNFSSGVAISGETALIGARREDTLGPDAGAAYIFERGFVPPPATPTATATPTPVPVTPGDADCSGTVNAIDAAIILQFVADLLEALPCPANGDANVSGSVDAIDATLVLQFTAGLLPGLPP